MEHFRKQPESGAVDNSQEKVVDLVREILDGINEEALFCLIAEEISKAGADTQLLKQLVPISEVITTGDLDINIRGAYSMNDGITINKKGYAFAALEAVKRFDQARDTKKLSFWSEIKDLRERLRILLGDSHPLFLGMKSISVIKTLVHEELHALTDSGVSFEDKIVIDSEYQLKNKRSFSRSVGFKKSEVIESSVFDGYETTKITAQRFIAINEAITEIKARKLARAYLESYPPQHVSSADIAFIFDNIDGSYNHERFVCRQLIIILATLAEVPIDVIENGFFKAYLLNDHFLPVELAALVADNCPQISKDMIESLLNKLEITLSDDNFDESSDVSNVFNEFITLLPEKKRNVIKDAFAELFKEFNPEVFIE